MGQSGHSRQGFFQLTGRRAAKDSPALVGDDERHLGRVAGALAESLERIDARLTQLRASGDAHGTAALERDQEVHRLSARRRALARVGVDVTLGRLVPVDGDPVYVGRFGLADAGGERLLVDWRTPAAEPFFAATRAQPHGVVSRRRYRWGRGRVVDYWDELLVSVDDQRPEQVGRLWLDDESAFLATLGASRSPRMRDVLGTLQADQDAIIRAGSRDALVVDGGPGTGKTVVALHRAAYLQHADPRLGAGSGGVLVVGPHQPYLAYVEDVLPSLGEEGVRTATLADLVPEGAGVLPEDDPEVARLKSSAAMVRAVEPAVALYEEPPVQGRLVETPDGDVWIGADDWAEAFAAPATGTPHNLARDEVWEQVLEILADKLRSQTGTETEAGDLDDARVRRALAADVELRETFDRAWPLLEHTDVVGDLWSVPAYLRRCAPWLEPEQVRRLQRGDPHAWTTEDLPLLDAARLRLGDPGTSRRDRRRRASEAAERARMAEVVDHLVATDDSDLMVMSMLRGDDLRAALVDESDALATSKVDAPAALEGPFAHVVVDEAQELSDAEWQMVLARCPSQSLTVVGDRAQARAGFAESWAERLGRVGVRDVRVSTLAVNYRTPAEVMARAEPVIRAVVPDAVVPTAVRSSGLPVRAGTRGQLVEVVTRWLAENSEGTVGVLAAHEPPAWREVRRARPDDVERVRWLTPVRAKGLEFDLVVLVEPGTWGDGVQGAVDRYVAMTRATRELVVLDASPPGVG